MHSMIEWLGSAFTPEQYVFWTRVECTAWTLADVFIVFYLLRLADLARAVMRKPPHRISYIVWICTLPPAALIPFLTRGTHIFAVELLVTVPHFLIIVSILALDAKTAVQALTRLLQITKSAS